jgi:diguanylate cyclase (GGDEF)-like protein
MDKSFWSEPIRTFAYVKIFLTSLCTVLALFVTAIFVLLYWRNDDLTYQRMHEQALTYHDLIMHTKNWNFDYGGVYVEKRSKVESNIYLKRLGIDPDVKAVNGTIFTMRNHAIMINEISRMSELKEGAKFRITSLRPLDPENAPDSFEKQALEKFEHRVGEFSRIEHPPGKPSIYRYLTPLTADKSCLECHKTQGYKVGSIVGAVSIAIPVDTILREARISKILLIVAAVLVLGLLIGISYFLTWRLVKKLDTVQRRYTSLISTDELTRLRNRRYVLRRLGEECERADRIGTPLSILLIDIDHFKQVNDTLGHPFGDQVLRRTSTRMKAGLRRYDILGRIGGEEFLIISPGATLEDATALAERIRSQISSMKVVEGDKECSVTISIGVTSLSALDNTPDILMRKADAFLYRAKEQGRNRVVCG